MRQFTIILLLAVHLLGNTELGQIVRLPKLISHFYDHKKENNHLSFFSFVMMHYCGDDGTSKDDDEDKQLPFHQIQNSNIHFTAALQPIVSFKSKVWPVCKSRQFLFKDGIVVDSFLNDLFRPPLL